jgi:hypothetical protein
MNKRNIFGAIAALAIAPFMIGRSEAAGRDGLSATFTVPRGVNKIRVRSYRNGKKVVDTALNVQPGQTFTIDAV